MVTPATSVLRRRPVRPRHGPAKYNVRDYHERQALERVLVRALRAVEHERGAARFLLLLLRIHCSRTLSARLSKTWGVGTHSADNQSRPPCAPVRLACSARRRRRRATSARRRRRQNWGVGSARKRGDQDECLYPSGTMIVVGMVAGTGTRDKCDSKARRRMLAMVVVGKSESGG
jgi:hypothetical protein